MLNGIDVSYANGKANLDNQDFIIIRASYGNAPDTKYAFHYGYARKANVVIGAYHFGVGYIPVNLQVNAFLITARDADFFALDLEYDPNGPMSNAQAMEFISLVKKARPDKMIGLYHSRSGFPLNLGQNFNWVADWGNKTPPNIPWTFWQWQGSPIDRDYFNGTIEDLSIFARKLIPVPKNTTLYAHKADTEGIGTLTQDYSMIPRKIVGKWILGTVSVWIKKP